MSSIGTAKYGMTPLPTQSATPMAPAVSNGAVSHGMDHPPFFSAESPALWLVGIGAVTLGFIAVSTSVQIGPFKVSGSAGK